MRMRPPLSAAFCLLAAASLPGPAALTASTLGGATLAPETLTPQMEPMQPPMPEVQPLKPMKSVQQLNPEQQADALYSEGISYRDKAEALQKEAASETDAKKSEKLEAKAKDKYLDAIKKFTEATKKNGNHFSAWGNLGNAYGKTGDFKSSIEACQKALDVEPNYTPAIEYRAEAYLALNRLDEVKSVYMSLFDMDRPRADELAAAIDKWVEKKKKDSSGVAPAKFEDFAQWAAQRKQHASGG